MPIDYIQDHNQQPHNSLESSRPTVEECTRLIEDLKYFLTTAPCNWQQNQIIRRYYLNHDEGFVSCIMWNNLYFMTGTDIVRCIVYRFEMFGREILDRKKFEEGIFSDLRSLKCGNDAVLEASKSPFLEFLYRNQCLRTQKKQKVFFWFSVPHDKLFADALERDIKKELIDQVGTTKPVSDPALSFVYDQERNNLHEQLVEYAKAQRELDEAALLEEEIGTPNNSTIPLSSSPSFDDHDNFIEQKFIIKEENNTPVITPGNFDDDFPLDYFPPNHEPLMIDPSVFFNPPDAFDDQLLIDQTYAKTPFQDTFDFRTSRGREINPKTEELDDDDEETVPLSHIPSVYAAHFATIPPSIALNGVPYQAIPQQPEHPYPFQPHFSYGGPHITNGQFYDSQANGEQPIELSPYRNEYFSTTTGPPPVFYGYSAYGQPQPGVSPQHFPDAQGAYGHEGYYTQFEKRERAEGEDGDEDDELYEAFERQQYYQHFLQQQHQQGVSPFGRFFPPFEATNPPSSKGLKFPKSATGLKHRVTKPSNLRKSRKPKKDLKTLDIIAEKGTVKFKDSNEVIGSRITDDKIGDSEHKKQEGHNENETDEEYNSLPTPESTAAHDHQSRE